MISSSPPFVSNNLSLCSSLNVRDQVSHPYRIVGKVSTSHGNLTKIVKDVFKKFVAFVIGQPEGSLLLELIFTGNRPMVYEFVKFEYENISSNYEGASERHTHTHRSTAFY
jgi:hypothetical protein